MWHFLQGTRTGNDDIVWNSSVGPGEQLGLNEDDGVMIQILFSPSPSSKFAAVQQAERLIGNTTHPEPLTWLTPGQHKWKIDLEGMRASQASLSSLDWLQGSIVCAPEYERSLFNLMRSGTGRRYEAAFTFYVTRETVGEPFLDVNRHGLKHEERWEFVRFLDAGGQAKVSVVRDKTKCTSRDEIRDSARLTSTCPSFAIGLTQREPQSPSLNGRHTATARIIPAR